MAEHRALIRWSCSGDFLKGTYSREHTWTFDCGTTVAASSSPSVVREPYSNPMNVDPEEAFVAAISSCHMLTFLYEASRAGIAVAAYEDDAVGKLARSAAGVVWVSTVTLRPRIVYDGQRLSDEVERRLHEAAHAGCFIANSVKTDIRIEHPAD